ncbi:hypothetical protein LXL04_021225 [Taraxacum kok-saghyz]
MHKNKKKKLHICKSLKKISFFRKKILANCNHFKRFGGSRSRFFERNNGLGDIGNWGSSRVLPLPAQCGGNSLSSWFKREQIMKTRMREQTWSLDQFKWHFCSKGIIETTGPPPAPTGPPPAPTTGPPSDHRRTTVGPPSDHRRCTTCTHRHIGPPPDHRRTTAGNHK